ncbi:phage virion morphogenesis protein [uncultured Desulfuromusa sp.]|uniref:phage virion morphogenesis protein n=1 Tax=uncultured Desulfuromusa sp. TaxID=219183 RepID=UPI002AA8E8B1|nr:phage virion morphogenesis protein [uncultured Desulfuromusa sp.]
MAESFSVRIEDDQVQQALNRALKATGDLTPAMKAIGEHLLRSTEENFRGEHEPDGTPWKPLKVLSYHLGYSIGKKKATHTKSGSLTAAFSKYLAGRKILTDSHELRNSIHYSASRTSVAIGSGKVYAALHQFGGKAGRGKKVTIPARPFLGIGPGDRQEILAELRNHLETALKE